MTTTTLSLIQLECSDREDPDTRVARTIELTNETASDVDLVVLPELWHVGAFDSDAIAAAGENIDGPLVREFRKIAVRHGTWVHMGSFVERLDDGRAFNTSVLIDDSGEIAAIYRKIHLYGFDQGEATLMTAGQDVIVTPTTLGLTGISTCYDLRFPEMYRRQVDSGARALLMCSGWPEPRIEHWRTLVRARAIENQCFVVACNAVGRHAGITMGGHSVVIGPNGDLLAEGSAVREEVVSATIDLAMVESYRTRFPWLKDRRIT
jgi:predicted amidohydrolase